MTESPQPTTLFVVWPNSISSAPAVRLPDEYTLRTYRPGDEARFQGLCAAVGWNEDDESVKRYMDIIVPDGWFFVEDSATEVVATSGALHNTREGMFPFGGDIGYVTVAPGHRRRGIGRAVTAAAVSRLLAAGYRSIRIGVGPDPSSEGSRADDNLPALRTYLALGFQPLLYSGARESRWQAIFEAMGRPPFTPSSWPRI